MSKISNTLYDMEKFEDLAKNNHFINHIHPLIKMIITVIYIITLSSYGPYSLNALWLWFVYPVFIIIMADIPVKTLIKMMLPGLMLIIGLGVFNPIFDSEIINKIGFIPVSLGFLSMVTLWVKGVLTLCGALLLVSTTGLDGLTQGFYQLRVPKLLIMQFVMTYRYIYVLLEEVDKTLDAYALRSPYHQGIHWKAWGPMMGQVMIRTFYRSERIYEAMVMRGFSGEYHIIKGQSFRGRDIIYLLAWLLFFALIRLSDHSTWLIILVKGVIG